MEAELNGNTCKEQRARRESVAHHFRTKYSKILGQMSPPVLLQQLPDEALGQLARVAEELLVKVVVHGRDVSQRLLLGVAQEG